MQQMKLSIIMPCYNVADTIERALDSVISQKVDFSYEIVVVDDASEDATVKIVDRHAKKYPYIRVIKNETNQGNAMSFYKGLQNAYGDYYCVLDGDDYYTVSDKLKKQVSFLDQDEKQEYAAVAHYFIIDLGNGEISVPDCGIKDEFTYIDFITQNSGYYHTATYMYRNIYKGNIPEYFKTYRGDTPRTMFQLMFTNKKVKVLNFVGSAYTFTYNGIWSGMKEKAQFEYQIAYYSRLQKVVNTGFEQKAVDKLLDFYSKKTDNATDTLRKYPQIDIDTCLVRARRYAEIYAFSEKEYTLSGLYYSEYIDSLCATLGYMHRLYFQENIQTEIISDHICIVIGVLNPRGGGIFREITEIVEMYSDHKVYILATNMDAIDEVTREALQGYPNVVVIHSPKDCASKLDYFYKRLKEISPKKAYFYSSHNDTVGQALMQPGPCRNICLFSFDHGYICGISNPNLDCLIAKRPSDYGILQALFPEKTIYIPTWSRGAEDCENFTYQPFKNHTRLITACGAARFYKINGGEPYPYIDMILELLTITKGIHYHFGPIPEDKKEYIRKYLHANSLAEDAFVQIDWVDNVPKEALMHHVDVFIEPFPVVSYKLTLEMLACGIPIFAFDGIKRLSKMDFIYPGNLLWRTKEEFVSTLAGMDSETLRDHSSRAVAYFNETHAVPKIKPYFVKEKEFGRPEFVFVVDNLLQDIRGYLRLFGDAGKINIMMKEQEALKKAAAAAKEAEVKKDEAKRNTQMQIEAIKASSTYRAGYAILWFPRTVCKFFRLSAQKGIITTLRYMKNEDYLSDKGTDSVAVLKRLKLSHTLHAGRIVLLPLKGLRYIYRKLKAPSEKKKRQNLLSFFKIQLEKQYAKLNMLEALPGITEQLKALSSIQEELKALVDIKRQLNSQSFKLRLFDALPGMQNQLDALSGMPKEMGILSDMQKQSANTQKQNSRILRELVWADVYNNTVQNSEWLTDNSFSPGRWAVGYPFLYVMYRILNQVHPVSILELGLGQSTHMITQYVEANSDVKHVVVEQNQNWVDFFLHSTKISSRTEIRVLEYSFEPYKEAEAIRTYKGFSEAVAGRQFDLILIDAPSAEGMTLYSRIDALKIIPGNISKTFVVMLDDYHRPGEAHTAREIEHLFAQNHIAFEGVKYGGEKDFYLWCSPDISFLCTM